MSGLESALKALQIATAKPPIPNCTRCLADTEDHRRCIRPPVPDLTKMTKFKSLDDCIMDCLCKTHKYHLERQPAIIIERYQLLLHANTDKGIKRESAFHTPFNPTAGIFTPHGNPPRTPDPNKREKQGPKTPIQPPIAPLSKVYSQPERATAQTLRSWEKSAMPPSPGPSNVTPVFASQAHESVPYRSLGRASSHTNFPVSSPHAAPRWTSDRSYSPQVHATTPLQSSNGPRATMTTGTAENQGSGLMQFRTFAKISRAVWLKIGREQAAAEFRGDIATGEEELSPGEKQWRLLCLQMEHLLRIQDDVVETLRAQCD
ncbi:MAG: hypothetical protein Q9180_005727 [Flavoplaca navasiana]